MQMINSYFTFFFEQLLELDLLLHIDIIILQLLEYCFDLIDIIDELIIIYVIILITLIIHLHCRIIENIMKRIVFTLIVIFTLNAHQMGKFITEKKSRSNKKKIGKSSHRKHHLKNRKQIENESVVYSYDKAYTTREQQIKQKQKYNGVIHNQNKQGDDQYTDNLIG